MDVNFEHLPDIRKDILVFAARQIPLVKEKAKSFVDARQREQAIKSGTVLEKYLQKVGLEKYLIKTLIYEDAPVPISSIYVPISLSNQREDFFQTTVSELLMFSQHILITGTAGSGKSTAFRHFFLEELVSGKSCPIMVNLREANQLEPDLLALITHTLDKYAEVQLSQDELTQLLEIGSISLFLDGLDEVIEEKRDTIARQIIHYATKYPDTAILVSSRPTERASWEKFVCLEVQPLQKEEAKALIQKLEIDLSAREKFLTLLDDTLYESHESFASNPLLLSLMLLMFNRNAEIPKKWHLFYQEAFETLFNRHDAKKPGGYKRVYKTQLAIDDFSRILEAICLLCCAKGVYSSSKDIFRDLASKASNHASIKVEPEDILYDLEKQVCLLMEEGTELRFAHKTFVEYFAAKFVARLENFRDQKKVLRTLGQKSVEPVFVSTLFQSCPRLTRGTIILGELKRIEKRIACRFDSPTAHETFITFAAPAWYIEDGKVWTHYLSNPITDVCRWLETIQIWQIDHYAVSTRTKIQNLLESEGMSHITARELRHLSPETYHEFVLEGWPSPRLMDDLANLRMELESSHEDSESRISDLLQN